jgi:iron complex transport system ATP-binding protein
VTSIEVRGVSVSYDGVPAVRNVSLTVPAARWVALIGPNGAGKTTLLRALGGLVPHAGEISLFGKPLGTLSRRDLSRRVAFVPQRPLLPPALTTAEYVLMGRTPHISYLGVEGAVDLQVARDVLRQLDLLAISERAVGSLSGGEAQRAVLGRALCQRAPILLLDEPTASLDIGHGQQVLELVDRLRRTHRLTVLSAMHDLTLAGQFADALMLLSEGRVVAAGDARAVITEAAVREHYGASVQVRAGSDGEVVVIPTRSRRATRS